MLHFKAYSYSGADDRHSMQQFLLSTLSNILCYKVPSVTFRDLLTMKNSSQWRGLKMTALSSYVKSYDLRGTMPQPPLPFHCNACSIIYSLWSGYTMREKEEGEVRLCNYGQLIETYSYLYMLHISQDSNFDAIKLSITTHTN